MYLHITDINPKALQEAQNIFPESYKNTLKWKPFFSESLLSRATISQYIWKEYLPQEDSIGIPLFQDQNLWSISHKKWIIFVWVSDFPLGVDIEYFLEKSPELLEIFPIYFYEVLWGKTWKNFYILWTSFEAIQKMERWENIVVEDFSLLFFESKTSNISEISFHTRTLYECKEKSYQVFTGFEENRVYSVCTSQNIAYEIIA